MEAEKEVVGQPAWQNPRLLLVLLLPCLGLHAGLLFRNQPGFLWSSLADEIWNLTPRNRSVWYGDKRPPVQPLRVASVIAGQLRGMTYKKNVARVNRLTKQSDVFICTDRLYQGQIGSLTGVVGTRFIEEDPSWKEKVNLTKELQWWRLQQCWEMIQDFEAEHGFSYAFYMKIRTDCHKRGGCEPSRKTYDKIRKDFGPHLDDKIFARSDQTFGGTRASFSRAATLFSRIPDYWQNVRAFWPVDFELLRRSDGFVNKYVWIPFPRAVVSRWKVMRCCEPGLLRNSPELAKELNEWVRDNCQRPSQCKDVEIQSRLPLPHTDFASEQAFLLDFLRVGIEIHGFRQNEQHKHAGPLDCAPLPGAAPVPAPNAKTSALALGAHGHGPKKEEEHHGHGRSDMYDTVYLSRPSHPRAPAVEEMPKEMWVQRPTVTGWTKVGVPSQTQAFPTSQKLTTYHRTSLEPNPSAPPTRSERRLRSETAP
ncbi:unnamed protein product [Symbiodinium sp. CCMP2456]|nr:unnamed protein product [Symbiodinium sp. CCMP2456]